MHIIALIDLDFLLRSGQNCKKCTFLDNLQTMSQEGNLKTKQMTSFFSSIFYALFVTLNFVFENRQNSFWCGPPLGPFCSVQYLNFGKKLPIQTTHHTFLESKHPEVTKNPYYVLSPEWSQKMVSAHGLINTHQDHNVRSRFRSTTDIYI